MAIGFRQPERFELLRWIALVPSSILCVLVVLFPIHWMALLVHHLGTSNDDTGTGGPLSIYYYLAQLGPEALELFGNAVMTPLVVITCASRVAPKLKFEVAIGIAILLGVFYGYTYTVIWEEIQDGRYTSVGHYIRLAVTSFLQLAGICSGLIFARRHARGSISSYTSIPPGDA